MLNPKKLFQTAVITAPLLLTACAGAVHDPLVPLAMSPDVGVRAATQGYLETKYPDYKAASDSVRAQIGQKQSIDMRVVGKNPDGSVRLESGTPLFFVPQGEGKPYSASQSSSLSLPAGVAVQTPVGGVSPQGANANVGGVGGGITWNP